MSELSYKTREEVFWIIYPVIDSNVENTERQIGHYCTPLQIVH